MHCNLINIYCSLSAIRAPSQGIAAYTRVKGPINALSRTARRPLLAVPLLPDIKLITPAQSKKPPLQQPLPSLHVPLGYIHGKIPTVVITLIPPQWLLEQLAVPLRQVNDICPCRRTATSPTCHSLADHRATYRMLATTHILSLLTCELVSNNQAHDLLPQLAHPPSPPSVAATSPKGPASPPIPPFRSSSHRHIMTFVNLALALAKTALAAPTIAVWDGRAPLLAVCRVLAIVTAAL